VESPEIFSRGASVPYNSRLVHVLHHVRTDLADRFRFGRNLKQLVTAGLRLYQGGVAGL